MNRNIRYRLGGLAAIAVGVAIGWWGLWAPLLQARAHAERIDYSLKAYAIVPFAIVFGVAFLIWGADFDYRDEERRTLKPAGWAAFGVGALISALLFWWFNGQFTALGYA